MKRFLIIFIISITLFSSIECNASTWNFDDIMSIYGAVAWVNVHWNNNDEWILCYDTVIITISNDAIGRSGTTSGYDTISGCLRNFNDVQNVPFNSGNFTYSTYTQKITYVNGYVNSYIIMKGDIRNTSTGVGYSGEDYFSESNWVNDLWEIVTDYFGFTGKPFSWISKLGNFWKNRFDGIRTFWNNLFHKDDNGDIVSDMTIVSPTPLPSAPTPIPYNTFVEYDSQNNTYIYKYSYVDENNTTIIVTSPPDGGNGTGLRPTSEPIVDNYYPANPLDVPRDNNMWSPQFTINLGDGQTLDVDMNTMNDTLIQGAEPYLDDVDVASDMFSVIPNDWWMLIGFIACIPIICAIISRFLG